MWCSLYTLLVSDQLIVQMIRISLTQRGFLFGLTEPSLRIDFHSHGIIITIFYIHSINVFCVQFWFSVLGKRTSEVN
jgi:hypothetical protein